MRTTRQLSIALPTSMANALKERAASGAYASESEIVRDGLRALFARDEAVETWLRAELLTRPTRVSNCLISTLGSLPTPANRNEPRNTSLRFSTTPTPSGLPLHWRGSR